MGAFISAILAFMMGGASGLALEDLGISSLSFSQKVKYVVKHVYKIFKGFLVDYDFLESNIRLSCCSLVGLKWVSGLWV